MTFTFRPAKREGVSLLIGLAGGTGSGKTFTAMTIAKGIAGDKPFAVIDTESGRAKHYADQFRFDHGDLSAPYRPDAYAEAIKAADAVGYSVIVVDSMSHEHAGEGGLLEWQEEELQRLTKGDMSKFDAFKMLSWSKPKQSHKKMVNQLLKSRAHIILCFRAEAKIEMVPDPDRPGKQKVQPKQSLTGLDGWIPICEKTLPFEATVSFLFTADKPGYPKPIKLQEQHKAFFPLDQPITEEAGKRIAVWAAGGAIEGIGRGNSGSDNRVQGVTGASTIVISADQVALLETQCQDAGIPIDKLKKAAGVERLAHIAVGDYERAKDWIKATIQKRSSTTT